MTLRAMWRRFRKRLDRGRLDELRCIRWHRDGRGKFLFPGPANPYARFFCEAGNGGDPLTVADLSRLREMLPPAPKEPGRG